MGVQYARSEEARAYLASQRDARGRSIRVIKLPLPPPQYYTEVSSALGVSPTPIPYTLSAKPAAWPLRPLHTILL